MEKVLKPTLSLAPLCAWFAQAGRSLPWRTDVCPYRVLVSEVMLQQTQAARVIPFFSRWMTLFPTLHALAAAPEEAIIKAWEGLGYYSRARALHRTAQIIVSDYGGEIPNDETSLLFLPGIGPYTAGAIRAFAFHERAAAVDANVRRVIKRLLPPVVQEDVTFIVEELLPQESPWIAMEALIELGACICKPVPTCSTCPLADHCYAFATQTQQSRPEKGSPARISLYRDVAIFVSQGNTLVSRRTGKQVMSGLYEFPYFDSKPRGLSASALIAFLQSKIPSQLSFIGSLPETSHSFTRFHATLYPTIISCEKTFPWEECEWVNVESLKSLPFSSGHKRILEAAYYDLLTLQRSASLAYL